MVNILKHPRAKIADVQCSRLKLEPGDRIIVKVYDKMDSEQAKKLRKGIQKWAGSDIEVLIYNPTQMEISVDKAVRVS